MASERRPGRSVRRGRDKRAMLSQAVYVGVKDTSDSGSQLQRFVLSPKGSGGDRAVWGTQATFLPSKRRTQSLQCRQGPSTGSSRSRRSRRRQLLPVRKQHQLGAARVALLWALASVPAHPPAGRKVGAVLGQHGPSVGARLMPPSRTICAGHAAPHRWTCEATAGVRLLNTGRAQVA